MSCQEVKFKKMENSKVYQAGGDININEIPSKLLEQLGDFLSTQGENQLLNKFLQEKMTKVKEFIDDNKFNEAEYEIESLVKEDSKSISSEIKAKLYYYEGLICLYKSDIDGTTNCIRIIKEIGKELDKACELQYRVAVQIKDDKEFEKALNDLSQYENYKNQIELKRAFYKLSKNNFREVISLLMYKDDIKEIYSENDSALYYLGTALINMNRYEEASKYLDKAYSIRQLKSYKYNLIISQTLPIISRVGAAVNISKDERAFLNNKLAELLPLKQYFMRSTDDIKTQFWGYTLNIELFTEPNAVITQYIQLPETIKKERLIQFTLAEAYNLTKDYEKAIEIYKLLYSQDKNIEILIKILDILMAKGENEEVLDLLNDIDFDDYDGRGIMISIYLEAISKVKDFSIVEKKIIELENIFKDKVFFLCTSAVIFYKHQKYEQADNYLKNAIKLIIEDNDLIRIYVAETCYDMKHINEAIKLLTPLEKYNEHARKLLLDYLLKLNNEGSLNHAERIVDREIQKGSKESYLLEIKANILMVKELWDDALNTFKESFDIHPSVYSASNIVAIKINKNDEKDLNKYIRFLKENGFDRPDTKMLLALAHNFLGDKGVSKELAFLALYKLGNVFNSNIFIQYISLCFNDIKDSKDAEVEYKNVKENSVVELIDNIAGNSKLICINNERSLIKKEGEEAIGCSNYSINSSVAIRILNKSIGETVNIGNHEYKIKSIINKNVYACRYCIQLYSEKCPESYSFKLMKASSADEMIKQMIPILKAGDEREKFLLEQYNFKNTIGLPIDTLCNKDYTRYYDTIVKLLYTKKQLFYSGEVNEININDTPIVLTLSSIIMLKIFNKLSNLINCKENVYIPNSLIQLIKGIFKKVYALDINISGTVQLTEDGKPFFIKITEEQKQTRLNFWRDIIDVVEEFKCIDEIEWEDSELIRVIRPLIDNFELDCIFLSKKLAGVYISDDLFMRKLGISLVNNLKTTNFISIIEQNDFVEFSDCIDIICQISGQGYTYACNENLLYKMLNSLIMDESCKTIETIENSKVYKIILNFLSTNEMFNNYFIMIERALFRICSDNADIRTIQICYIIQKAIREQQMKYIDEVKIQD